MPTDSKVHKVYEALKKKGMSKERAAKISQAQTGQALATGKPTKHENAFENGRQRALNAINAKIGNESDDRTKKGIELSRILRATDNVPNSKDTNGIKTAIKKHQEAISFIQKLISESFYSDRYSKNGLQKELNDQKDMIRRYESQLRKIER